MRNAPRLTETTCSHERILIIYTGGTIGMQPTATGLMPAGNFADRLHNALQQLPIPQQQALPAYDIISHDPLIDSSAATPATWQTLAGDIAERFATYRGFVILHGTDTLSWSASSLAYQLQGLDKAVVLTGAMQPLEAANSDALDNICGALQFAAMSELQEVAIYFAGRLMRGVRAVKQHCEAMTAFASPNYPCWANG